MNPDASLPFSIMCLRSSHVSQMGASHSRVDSVPFAKSIRTLGNIKRLFNFQVFSTISSPNICENIRAGLPDVFGIIRIPKDQHLTKFVQIRIFFCFFMAKRVKNQVPNRRRYARCTSGELSVRRMDRGGPSTGCWRCRQALYPRNRSEMDESRA